MILSLFSRTPAPVAWHLYDVFQRGSFVCTVQAKDRSEALRLANKRVTDPVRVSVKEVA